MGDYAITKVIIKLKESVRVPIESLVKTKAASLERLDDTVYDDMWKSIGVEPFYYSAYPFGCGSFHAYTTALGTSDVHDDSDFYEPTENSHYNTVCKDGLWFVEFSSKVGEHYHFIDHVVPIIAEGWLGLTGDEYQSKPTLTASRASLITSNDPYLKGKLDNFNSEIDSYKEDEYVFGYI